MCFIYKQLTTKNTFSKCVITNRFCLINIVNHLEGYDLGSSANVAGIKKALKNKELIDTIGTRLQIADPILQHWLRANLFS